MTAPQKLSYKMDPLLLQSEREDKTPSTPLDISIHMPYRVKSLG